MGASAQPNSGTSEVHCIQIAVHGRAPPSLHKQYWLFYFSRRVEASQRSLHNAPIFRLLLKVAVNGTHQCDFLNFCGASGSNCTQHGSLVSPALALPIPCKLSLLLPFSLPLPSTVCFSFAASPSSPPNASLFLSQPESSLLLQLHPTRVLPAPSGPPAALELSCHTQSSQLPPELFPMLLSLASSFKLILRN